MFKKALITVTSPTLTVFLPGSVPQFEPHAKFITYLEHQSYMTGYVISWTDGTHYFQTKRFYSEDLYANLVAYLSKHDEPLNLSVSETNHNRIYELVDVIFPDYFKLVQYTEVKEFIPLVLKYKHCNNETYDEVYSNRDVDDLTSYGVHDSQYQGPTTFSVDLIMDNLQKSTKFTELNSKDTVKLKTSINDFKPLKGLFRLTPRTVALIKLV